MFGAFPAILSEPDAGAGNTRPALNTPEVAGMSEHTVSQLSRAVKVLKERFWGKVNKDGPAPSHCPELGPCWIWTGIITIWGYGRIKSGGKMHAAHRVAWVLAYGDIPDGLFVCHKCDNPACVRPEHLFVGTVLDNTRDREAKGRGFFGQ